MGELVENIRQTTIWLERQIREVTPPGQPMDADLKSAVEDMLRDLHHLMSIDMVLTQPSHSAVQQVTTTTCPCPNCNHVIRISLT